MSDSVAKSYSSIYELPSEVRASFDEADQQKWLDNYTEFLGNGTTQEEIEDAKFKAWKSMVDAPSSLAVESWASTEIRDADGELVPIDTIEENMEQFIRNGGTVHDSHSNVVIGNIWGWEKRHNDKYNEDGIVVYFNINHDGEVAERARDDILSGRKNSMSIGAEAPRGGYKCDDRGCYVERDVTDLYEISICETPANQSAVFINVGKDIAKAKQPLKGEVIRFGIKDVYVHQDYTTCPLQKCKKVLRDKGFVNVHIKDNGIVTAKSKREYPLFKAISTLGFPFRYDLKKQQFEIIPDYGVEQAVEEALENGWAHEDNIGHITLTKEIPKEIFIDWFDRGFIVKIGDNYCLKNDDVAKDGGAMGVASAGATNPVYGSKPTSLTYSSDNTKFGRKRKAKKEMLADGNIHGPAPTNSVGKKKRYAIFDPDDEIGIYKGKKLVFDDYNKANKMFEDINLPDGSYMTQIDTEDKPIFFARRYWSRPQ